METLANNVFYCGEKHPQRTIFDQLIPLPQGTTYNSFLIIGSKKTALVDTIYPQLIPELVEKLEKNNIASIDYIIANHGEQDHSGALPTLLEKFPNVMIVTNPKCKELLIAEHHIEENKFIVISDKESLSLGDKTLEFYFAPWVHWPDTMFTYLKEDNILFTCDFLGAHHTQGSVFADNSEELMVSAKRYYAEIMMPYRNFCKKYISLVEEINPQMICPSHGPIYKEPRFIIDLYKNWTSDEVEKKVVIPYVSMYNSSYEMAERLAERISKAGIKTVMADLVHTDEGEIAMELVDAGAVVLACSMVLAGPHPKAVYVAYLMNLIKPKMKFFSILGSFGWGGRLTETIDSLMPMVKAQKLDYIVVKGKPTIEDLHKVDKLADELIEKINSL